MSKLWLVPTAVGDQVLDWDLAINSVRAAFESIANGDSTLYPVQVMRGTVETNIFAVKAGVDQRNALVGFKFGGYWPGNVARSLPAHSSTTVLLDPETGYPFALVSGKHLNLYRTAAADAVAAAALSRTDAAVLGVIGAGQQAEFEIRAVAKVRALTTVKIHARSAERGLQLLRRLDDLGIDIRLSSAEEAVRGSDIVVTVTPATAPVIEDEWVEPGTHISAMGADVGGKQELPLALIRRARLFADHPEQAIAIGEFQHGHREGLFADDAMPTPIGLVTQGRQAGRTSDSEITVFDSSGIAIQDLAVAQAVVERAIALDAVAAVEI